MGRSHSWIDPDRLSVALVRAGIRRHARDRGSRRREAQLNADMPLVVAAKLASRSGPTPPPSAARVRTAPFEPPEARLATRLDAFARWVEGRLASHSIFLVDDAGLPLLERNTSADLVACASALSSFAVNVSEHLGTQLTGNLLLESTHGLLQLLRVDTELGFFVLGCEVTRAPEPATASEVGAALGAAIRSSDGGQPPAPRGGIRKDGDPR